MFNKILHNLIYLDNASATKMSGESLKAFIKASKFYANPSSIHLMGKQASDQLANCRTLVRQNAHASSNEELIFTSGGTESNTLAVRGILNKWHETHKNETAKVLCSSLEHPSVVSLLEEMPNVQLHEISCNEKGQLNTEELSIELAKGEVVLVCCVHTSGEVGTVQPIVEIARQVGEVRGKDVHPLFHVDASQGMQTHKANIEQWKCDTATFCSQKMNGPKGVGALYVKKGTLISSLTGGEGEYRLRSGTQSLGLVAAFTVAFVNSQRKLAVNKVKIAELRKTFLQILNEQKVEYIINGREKENSIILNISFPQSNKNSEELLIQLSYERIMASSKSACSNSQAEESKALMAMGKNPANSIRFSFSPTQSVRTIKKAAKIVSRLV